MSTVNSSSYGDPRESRGAQIAAMFNLRKRGEDLDRAVANRHGCLPGRPGEPHPTSTCPEHQGRRVKCKHIRFVEISLWREERPYGTTVVSKTPRVTYMQNWPAYNKAQTHETERFVELLHDLCPGIFSVCPDRAVVVAKLRAMQASSLQLALVYRSLQQPTESSQ